MDHADIWFTEHLLQNCLLAIYRVHGPDPQHATMAREKSLFRKKLSAGPGSYGGTFLLMTSWAEKPQGNCMSASTLDCKRLPRGICLSGCQSVHLQLSQKDKSTFEHNRDLHHVQLLPLLGYQIPFPLKLTSL